MPTLGYWNIRGLGQAIRLLLEYVGEDYEEKPYQAGPAPDFSVEDWLKEKHTLGFDFPNLPYYIDGDIKISQSNAILRHIARKHGLSGGSDAAMQAKVDMLTEQVMDMRNAAIGVFYNPKYAELKEGYLKDVAGRLEAFEKFLGDKSWLCGTEIMFPDFHLYELLDVHKKLQPTCLDNCPKLQAYTKRFEDLPKIKAYMESDRFMKGPINNPMAGWQGN